MSVLSYRADGRGTEPAQPDKSQPGHIKPIGPSYPIKPANQSPVPEPHQETGQDTRRVR
jgi:hypothetical protein